jgi:hypothetical protein
MQFGEFPAGSRRLRLAQHTDRILRFRASDARS